MSSLNNESLGFSILPANKTLLHFIFFINLRIFPNCPILTWCEFLSFLNLFFFVRSIIKYFLLLFLNFLIINSGKSVLPRNKPIILF